MTSPDVHGDQAAVPAAVGDASSGIAPTDVAGLLEQPRSHEVQGSLAIVVQAASSAAADSGEEKAFTDTHHLLSRMPSGMAAAVGAAAVVQLAIRTTKATSAESSAPAPSAPTKGVAVETPTPGPPARSRSATSTPEAPTDSPRGVRHSA